MHLCNEMKKKGIFSFEESEVLSMQFMNHDINHDINLISKLDGQSFQLLIVMPKTVNTLLQGRCNYTIM